MCLAVALAGGWFMRGIISLFCIGVAIILCSRCIMFVAHSSWIILWYLYHPVCLGTLGFSHVLSHIVLGLVHLPCACLCFCSVSYMCSQS